MVGPGRSGSRKSSPCAPHSSSTANSLDVRADLPQMDGGGRAHRDVILLARARRDRVDARGVREHAVLGDQARGHVLGDHEPGVEPALVGQERRQAVRHRRVQHPLDPPLRDRSQLGEADLQRVERDRHRLAVEVPVRDDLLALGQDERVVGGRVQLDSDSPLGVVDRVADGAMHLRRAPKRVRVLHAPAPAVRGRRSASRRGGRTDSRPKRSGRGAVGAPGARARTASAIRARPRSSGPPRGRPASPAGARGTPRARRSRP